MLERVGRWTYETYPGTSRVGAVFVHEVFGLTEYARSVSQQLSQSGFPIAAVDLYKGRIAKDLEEGFTIRSSLKKEEILEALSGGVNLLKNKLGADLIGTVGFCMGGGFALMGASNLGLPFCVDYYGMMQDAEDINGINGPLLLVLAGEDERITTWALQSLLPAAYKHKKRLEVQLYPNVRHAFHRPGGQSHNAAAAEDAWTRTLAFLSGMM